MIIDFIILMFFIKKEFNDQQSTLCKYLLDPISKEYSELVISELGRVLRNDICLIVNSNTTSIFRYKIKRQGLQRILSYNRKLVIEPFVKSNLSNFFVDKESLVYFSDLEKAGQKVLHYNYSLVPDKFHDLLIKAYRKLTEREIQNSKFYEFNIKTEKYKNFKEYRIEHCDIGIIHNTVYKKECNESYNILTKHFRTFISDINLIDKPFFEITDKYLKSLTNFLIDKNLLNENIPIYNLLPFKFTKNLSDTFHDEHLISGGICFDRLTEEQKKHFNISEFCKYGDRYIFTYKCSVKKSIFKNNIYKELI
ncbi:uncharacterized protein VNE69_06066 [Vairimorpha necatrix]|uniref:Uncharacterized protein n=1 Tax=Vairimorpha necatrix TaxID=6039 RepID=A0AAX4JCQ9_9MICR